MPHYRTLFFYFSKQIQHELSSVETMYGLMQRVVGVESAITIVQQFTQLRGYLDHLLLPSDRKPLSDFLNETTAYITDLRKPIYMCVTSRVFDLQNILTLMGKVKWDINHVNVEHSSYVNVLNKVTHRSMVYKILFVKTFNCNAKFYLGPTNILRTHERMRTYDKNAKGVSMGLFNTRHNTHFGRRVNNQQYKQKAFFL